MRKPVSGSVVLLALFAMLVCGGCSGSGSGSNNSGSNNSGSNTSSDNGGGGGTTGGGGGTGTDGVADTSRTLSGSVTASGAGVQGARVILSGTANAAVVTDAVGNYTFTGLADGNYTVTPVKETYVMSPKAKEIVISQQSATNVNFNSAPSSNIFYVVDDIGNLGTVNVATGDVTVIGVNHDTAGTVILSDVAFDKDGNLYGVSTSSLYRVNKSNAALTFVGTPGIPNMNSMIFNNSGSVLFTADSRIYTLNTGNGMPTRIGNDLFQYQSSGDLAFLDNRLYLTSIVPNTPTDTALVRLDTQIGSLVGLIGYPNVFGLASDDNVRLYGFSGSKVIRINADTGQGTTVLDIGGRGLSNIFGAAFYQ